jgi:hypothetical protein
MEHLRQVLAELDAELHAVVGELGRIEQEHRRARQRQADLLERRAQAQQLLDQQQAQQRPPPLATAPEPSEDEIAALAALFPRGQQANRSVDAEARRLSEAQAKKDEADRRAAEADRWAADAELRAREAEAAPTANWKTKQNEERAQRLREKASQAEQRATEAHGAADEAERELTDAQHRLDAQQNERRAIVEFEQAVQAGAGEPELEVAWRKVQEAAKQVIEAGGTPSVLLGDGDTTAGEVASAQERQRRGQRGELAQQQRDAIDHDIAFERQRLDTAERKTRQLQQQKQDLNGKKSKLKGKNDAGSRSKLARVQADLDANEQHLEAAKAQQRRARNKLTELEQQQEKLDRYIAATRNVEAKEQAVEQAREQGGAAEAAAKKELAEAQEELDAAAKDLEADAAPEEAAAGEPSEKPENSLDRSADQEAGDTTEIAADGATVVQPGTAPDPAAPPAPPTIGGQAWGTTSDDNDQKDEPQGQQQQFTAPDPALEGPAGNPCSDQQASAFCGGKVDGGGILGQPVGGDRNPPREPCPGTEGVMGLCRDTGIKDEPLVNRPPDTPAPTGNPCTDPNVSATCRGKEGSSGTRETVTGDTGDKVRWLTPEEMASGIVVDGPPVDLSANAKPVLSGAVSGQQTPPSGATGGNLDSTLDTLFPPANEGQGGGQITLPAPNPVFVLPGFGAGVGVNQQPPATDWFDVAIPSQFEQAPTGVEEELFDRCGNLC